MGLRDEKRGVMYIVLIPGQSCSERGRVRHGGWVGRKGGVQSAGREHKGT